MNLKSFKTKLLIILVSFLILILYVPQVWSAEIAITIDDPGAARENNPISWEERTQKILNILKKHNLKITLFVTGKRVDTPEGHKIIKMWNDAGHIIANHSYSHLYYHSDKVTFNDYSNDILKNETVIKSYKNFKKYFRFPYLKEGNTINKRDSLRKLLTKNSYKNGYVTIDASDWYIDQRMRTKMKKDPKTDLSAYKKFYKDHIWDRTNYYDSLATQVLQNPVKHILLIHDNLLNAYFLDDLIVMYKNKGWTFIDSDQAYQSELAKTIPNTMPAGESLIWALAKQNGKIKKLRYPAEDGKYEEDKMDQLGL